MATYTPKASEITRDWHVIDAEGMVLGRMATEVARLLRGKHKTIFAPHIDTGDHVIIINADKVIMTSDKAERQMIYTHSGYPGGIKSRTADKILDGAHPERVVTKAVERMIPGGPLGRQVMKNLRVYAGTDHPHAAQDPQVLDVAAMNDKNTRSN